MYYWLESRWYSYYCWKNTDGQCNVSDWTDIVEIIAEHGKTVGLKADSTVVAVGYNKNGQCNVDGWTDIVAITASHNHTVGLKTDGTVVATGSNEYSQCDVGGWTDIVAIVADSAYTVGVKANGTVVNTYNLNWTRGWKLFDSIDTIEQEIEQKMARAKEHYQAKLLKEKSDLQRELSNLKGLFAGRRRKEIEVRLLEIGMETKSGHEVSMSL